MASKPSVWGYRDEPEALHQVSQPPPSVLNRKPSEPPAEIQVAERIVNGEFRLFGRQDGGKAGAALASYYRHMASLIQFPPEQDSNAADQSGFAKIRTIGVIRSINEPSARGDELYAPWELELIEDATEGGAAGEEQGGRRRLLQLYSRTVERFTGLHVGAVIGIEGSVHKRDPDGNVLAILLQNVYLPRRIDTPWNPASVQEGLAVQRSTYTGPIRTLRIHSLSGPFPREERLKIITTAVRTSATRSGDVLVITGPFVTEYTPEERSAMLSDTDTFEQHIEAVMDAAAKTIEETQSSLKVVLVPSLEDVVAFPVLPQPPMQFASDDVILLAPNPGELMINGVKIGFTSCDPLGQMRDRMVERWSTMEGSLRRVAEAVVNSRMYLPVWELPATEIDVNKLDGLKIFNEQVGGSKEEATSTGVNLDTTPPHIIFMPSMKPQMVSITHTVRQPLLSGDGDGVMIINQGIDRPGSNFSNFSGCNLAEVTIENPNDVIKGGASCGGVHVRCVRIFQKNEE